MKKLSLQWRITLMTALLICSTCMAMNWLIGCSGRHYMDSIGANLSTAIDPSEGAVEYFDPSREGLDPNLTIVIYGAQNSFTATNWYITAAVTLLGGILAYFVSGRALRPLRTFVAQVEKVQPNNLADMKITEEVLPEFRQFSDSFNQMLERLDEGAFAPLLALGIPGSGTGAVLLGGLMMWGLNPGPLLFDSNPEFCWGLISSMYVANVFTLLVSILVIPFLIKILSVPVKYMIPIITCVCIVGAYSTSNSMYGVIIMFISGIVGYLLDKNGFPTAPMLLAFVLAPMLEKNMRKAFIASQGSLNIFVDSTLKLVLLAVFLVLILTPVVKSILRKMKAGKAQA